MSKKSKKLYVKLERLIVSRGYMSQDMCDKISRVGSRKESYWKRHIIDLCELVLDMNDNIDDDTKHLLEKSILWAKS